MRPTLLSKLASCCGTRALSITPGPIPAPLATFGSEELGKWKMLRGLRREVLAGKQVTVKQLNKLCLDHEEKLSTAIADIRLSDDESASLVRKLMNATPAEYAAVDEKIQQLFERRRQDLPGERHRTRLTALFADALSATEWNRPTKRITKEKAKKFLSDAMNDYSGMGYQVYTGFNLGIDDELAEALKNVVRHVAHSSPL